jgi:hypothetical protein
MLAIARFNWPFYVVAALVLFGAIAGVCLAPGPRTKLACLIVLAGAAWFLIGSLGVSHLIYDRSDLYRWDWLELALRGTTPRQIIFCHSGFDEASQSLRVKMRDTEWKVLDHFDAKRMTEPSIRRARRLFPPTPGTLPAVYNAWPTATASADFVFGLLAIHELRSEMERTAWFSEAKRCLKKDGRVVLVEHVRDAANFLAFGPGFVHFHSPASWRRCWENANFKAIDELRITPFVRVFVLIVP